MSCVNMTYLKKFTLYPSFLLYEIFFFLYFMHALYHPQKMDGLNAIAFNCRAEATSTPV